MSANQEEPGERHPSIRLFVEMPLMAGAALECTSAQANYLGNVMRLAVGDRLLVFNGRDGEWLARLAMAKKGRCVLEAEAQARPQTGGPDIHYLFAPLKKARLDYMVPKAT
jgi:16S rRNA (uracil1498-N3)-methyltransferase